MPPAVGIVIPHFVWVNCGTWRCHVVGEVGIICEREHLNRNPNYLFRVDDHVFVFVWFRKMQTIVCPFSVVLFGEYLYASEKSHTGFVSGRSNSKTPHTTSSVHQRGEKGRYMDKHLQIRPVGMPYLLCRNLPSHCPPINPSDRCIFTPIQFLHGPVGLAQTKQWLCLQFGLPHPSGILEIDHRCLFLGLCSWASSWTSPRGGGQAVVDKASPKRSSSVLFVSVLITGCLVFKLNVFYFSLSPAVFTWT